MVNLIATETIDLQGSEWSELKYTSDSPSPGISDEGGIDWLLPFVL